MKLRIPNLLDTIPEVASLYLAAFLAGSLGVGRFEHWSLADSLWWGVVTVTTTGYGDLSPETLPARVIAGLLMVAAWVFNILLAGLVAARLIVDSDAWTHEEQEEVKGNLRTILREMREARRAEPSE